MDTPPLGVKIIVILGLLGTGFEIISVLNLFSRTTLPLIIVGVTLFLIIVQLLVLMGLWLMQSWAYNLAVLVYGLQFIFSILQFAWITAFIYGILFGYLWYVLET